MEFTTIRSYAKRPGAPLNETALRRRQKCGKLPGIWNASRFLINVEALEQMLDAESRRNGGIDELKEGD